jgi:hypothetical protein
MALLFPRLAKEWDSSAQDNTHDFIQRDQRRISTQEYHRNYFTFGRDARMLSRAEIDRIVTASDPAPFLAATLKRLADEKTQTYPSKFATLLMQISDAVYSRPLLTPALLGAILDHSDALIRREDVDWELVTTSNQTRLNKIIRLGTRKLAKAQRLDILNLLVSHSAGLQTRAVIIDYDAQAHGLYGGEPTQSLQLFPPEKTEVAISAVRDQVAKACEAGAIWNEPNPILLINVWIRTEGGNAFTEWLKHVFADDVSIVRLANEIPEKYYQYGNDGTRII